MVNVTIKPVQQIKVKVNQQNKQTVHSSSVFVGATNVVDEINYLAQQTNTAIQVANSAYTISRFASDLANTKYNISGGLITGSVSISGNLTANSIVVDAGTF